MNMPDHYPFRSPEARKRYMANISRIEEKYWPIESRQRMVETSFGQTFIRESGQEGKPPLVLLPGGNNTSLMWWQNIEELSQHFKTYALDNIADFGRSIPVKDFKKADEIADWLNEVLDALDLKDKVNIAGLSYGGWVTFLYALKFQERLNKIVLLAPAATVLPLCKEFWIRVIFNALIPHKYCTQSLIHWLCEDMYKESETGRAILQDAIDDLYCGIRSFKPRKLPVPKVFTDSELQQIHIPALYIVGQNEKIYSAGKAVQRLKNIAQNIRTEVIPNAGHDLVFHRPDVINREIITFLQ